MARFRRSRRPRGPRRKTAWEWYTVEDEGDLLIGQTGNINSTGGGVDLVWIRPPAGTVDSSFPDVFRWPGDYTLTGLEGYVNLRTGPVPPTSTANFITQFWMGVMVWPGQDDVVPSDNFPDPSDGSHDWIWRVFAGGVFESYTFGGPQYWERYHSKARRKIQVGDGLLAVWGFSSLDDVHWGTAYDFALTANFRAIYLLP